MSRSSRLRSTPVRRSLTPGGGTPQAIAADANWQAQAILDLRLHRLTGLEQDKILKTLRKLLPRKRSGEGTLEAYAQQAGRAGRCSGGRRGR